MKPTSASRNPRQQTVGPLSRGGSWSWLLGSVLLLGAILPGSSRTLAITDDYEDLEPPPAATDVASEAEEPVGAEGASGEEIEQDARLAGRLPVAAPGAAPLAARGRVQRGGGGLGRTLLLLPRALLLPARIGLHVATTPTSWLAGSLSRVAPLHHVVHDIKRDRFFLPVFAVDPRLGLNGGFRAAQGNPFHDDGVLTYRAAYGGAHDQVFSLTARSRDVRMLPYRGGWSYRVTAKYENTSAHAFCGYGNEASRDSLVYYTQERFLLLGKLSYAPADWLRADLSLARQRTQIAADNETGGEETRIASRFPDQVTSPGPGPDPEKLWGELGLVFDKRNARGRPTAGWLAEIYFGQARAAGEDTLSYDRYGGELQIYLPLARGHTLLLRTLAEQVNVDADSVHFAELPGLGGRSTLRGYLEDRFVDHALILWSLEYRYAFAPHAELCLFADLGEVMPELTDPASPLRMNWEGIHRSYGAGLRFATSDLFCLRGFVAHSEEDLILTATLESAFDREDRRERR